MFDEASAISKLRLSLCDRGVYVEVIKRVNTVIEKFYYCNGSDHMSPGSYKLCTGRLKTFLVLM